MQTTLPSNLLVWNYTVANLTLMALGSSAPEIILNIIEIFGEVFFSGSLGPSTIVGSAAFNLLIISAVCVMSIPPGEVRFIKVFQAHMLVFCVSYLLACLVFAVYWNSFALSRSLLGLVHVASGEDLH